MNSGVGSIAINNADVSGTLACSAISGYGGAGDNFWRKAEAYIDVTTQREGLNEYVIKHSEALSSNVLKIRYDDTNTTPSLASAPSLSVVTDNSIHLSGIAHYGYGTVFNINYIANAGIFRKAYHPTEVGKLTSTFGTTVYNNPMGVPNVNDSFAVTSNFTFNIQNRISSASVATISVVLLKPNGATHTSNITLSRRANTYPTNRATTTVEYFTDESRRIRECSGGADVPWDSKDYGIFNPGNGPYAQVQNGTLRYPVSNDYGGMVFSGEKIYMRRFTKAAASSGTITFAGFNPTSYVRPYGTGDVNVLIWLTDQALYFDLGREFGIGGGDGSSMATAISAYSSRTATAINWTLGTYSTGNETIHNGTYMLIVVFRNANRTMTSITTT
jgi:hypothetical protein